SGYSDVSIPPVCSLSGDGISSRRVSPFGHRRIKAWLRLPDAFRSNPRPSSPVDARASFVGPYLLDHITTAFSCFHNRLHSLSLLALHLYPLSILSHEKWRRYKRSKGLPYLPFCSLDSHLHFHDLLFTCFFSRVITEINSASLRVYPARRICILVSMR